MTRLELKSSTTTSNVRGRGGGVGGTQGGHNLPPPVPLTFLSLVFRPLQRLKIGSPGSVLKLWGNLSKIKIVTSQFS